MEAALERAGEKKGFCVVSLCYVAQKTSYA